METLDISVEMQCEPWPMVEELGRTGIKILLVLYAHGGEPMYIRELGREAQIGGGSAYRALGDLARYGLVRIFVKYNHRFVELTEKGKKVAALVAEANRLLLDNA